MADVEGCDDTGEGGSDSPPRFNEHGPDCFLAEETGQRESVPGVALRIGAERVEDGGNPCHRFETSGVPAPTRQPILADPHMPDLARRGVLAPIQGSLEDQSGSHSTPELDEYQIAAGGMAVIFGQRRHGRVVGDSDRDVEALSQLRTEVESVPGEVGRLEDSAIRSYHSRRAHTNAEDRCARPGNHVLDHLCGQFECVLTCWRHSRFATGLHALVDATGEVEEGGLKGLMTQIQSDDLARLLVESEESWWFSTCRLTLAELTEETLIDEFPDEAGDCCSGKPRATGNLGPAAGPVTRDQFQCRAQIGLARVVLGRLGVAPTT